MRTIRLWAGVRMRQIEAAAEPEAAPRPVTLPVSWDDAAAEALCALCPGEGPVSLAGASAVWLGILGQRARQAGVSADIVPALHGFLRRRQAAPEAAIWQGAVGEAPGWVVNLGAFHGAGEGFDLGLFASACRWAAIGCALLAPEGTAYRIGLSGLDDLLAAMGVAYGSRLARDTAAALAALARAEVTLALESAQRDLLAAGADWPAPPGRAAIAGLAEAAAESRRRVTLTPGFRGVVGVFPPGPVDALLGVETAGIAPAFAPVRAGRLSRAAQDRLAAAGMSPEAALAASLSGDDPLPMAAHDAHLAMHDALTPYLHVLPARPEALPAPARGEAPA
ncbi:MAG: hypothetical protein ACU0B1_09815, partial [Thermohalobaculum sp.]